MKTGKPARVRLKMVRLDKRACRRATVLIRNDLAVKLGAEASRLHCDRSTIIDQALEHHLRGVKIMNEAAA
jgi:hypothetical protein